MSVQIQNTVQTFVLHNRDRLQNSVGFDNLLADAEESCNTMQMFL